MIVQEDITKLWNVDVENHLLAAAEDPSAADRSKELQILEGTYFNAGVLLMNLDRWRKKNISGEALKFVRENPSKIIFPSQDGLNAILQNKWMMIDIRWNCPSFKLKKYPSPAIIHYMTTKKPWNSNPRGKEIYYHYLSKTIWKD